MLNDAYGAGQRNKDQVKRDVQTGQQRGQQQVQQAQGTQPTQSTQIQPGTTGGATSGGI